MRETLPVQARLVSTGIPRAVVGVGKTLFLQPRLVFTGIPKAVVGVGEKTLSAARAGFYRNSQSCGWYG